MSSALRKINEGALDREGVSELSSRLGVGERHLTRLFVQHLGAAPIAIAQTRRAHFAKRLIEETRLPMAEIAFSSGFRSIRRFNASMKKCFDLTPTELRQRARAGDMGTATPARFVVRWSYRPPFDRAALRASKTASTGERSGLDRTRVRSESGNRNNPTPFLIHQ